MIDNVLQVLEGQPNGIPLVSLWKHFPQSDLKLDTLVNATLEDYQKYPSDLLKLAPHGRFSVVDFGCEIQPGSTEPGSTGSSNCKNCVVQDPIDWEKVDYVDPNDGHLGMHIEFVRKIRDELEHVPLMMTVFSPTMVGRKLSYNKLPAHFLQVEDTTIINDAISIISDVMVEFSQSCIDAGADGIFAAIQEADKSVIPHNLIDQMLSLNQKFMKEISKVADFVVLHLHGDDLEFQKAVDLYDPTALNWHDQTAGPSIKKAHTMFNGGLLGGLEPQSLYEGKIQSSINSAKKLISDVPLILAPGCVILQGTEDATLQQIFELYKE